MLGFALLLSGFLIGLFGTAQTPYSWQLTEEDGLPSNTVYDLFEDNKGYIWLGTDKGLVKYNGQEFKSYKSSKQRSLALTNLCSDDEGNIWCSNFSYQVFHTQGDSLVQLPLNIDEKQIEGHIKMTIFDGYVYVYSFNFAHRYHIKTKDWEYDFYKEFWPQSMHSTDNTVLIDIASKDKKIYLQFMYYIHEFDGKNLIKESIIGRDNDYFLSQWAGDRYISMDRNSSTILMFDNDFREVVIHNFGDWAKDTTIRTLSFSNDDPNQFWLCTSSGAIQFSDSKDSPFSELFLKGKQVSDVLEDREGNIWFSTLQNAVYVMPNNQINWFNEDNSFLADNHIRSVDLDDYGNLWIGSYHGEIQAYDLNKNFFREPLSSGIKKEVEGYTYLPNGDFCVFGERMINLSRNEILPRNEWRYLKDLVWLDSETVVTLVAGNFYMLRSDGYTINPIDSIKFKAYWNNSLGSIERLCLSVKGARSFVHFSDDTTSYAGSTSGLFWLHDESMTEVKNFGKSINTLHIEKAEDGSIWVSTASQGIFHVKEDKIIGHYGTNSGLKTDFFKKTKYIKDTLWAISDIGLYRIVGKDNFELFNRLDGFPANECIDMEVYKNRIWIATMSGLVSMSTSITCRNKVAPSIEVIGKYVNQNKSSLDNDLSYNENNIRFDLSVLAFRNRGSGKIMFRLNGLDHQWNELEIDKKEIRFEALPPNKYVFEVYAVNEDGIKSNFIKIPFSILPPFWQRWWFFILLFIAAGGLVSIFFALRIVAIKKQNRISQDLRSSQLTALKAQMNPHFMFNALNSIQEFVLMQQTREANVYLGKFARLMRKTLDQSNQTEITLEEELELLYLYLELEAIRFEKDFHYSVDVASDIFKSQISIPSMIIQPFVENAIKHGLLHKKTDRKLSINFYKSHGNLICVIVDNGIGLKASQQLNERRSKDHKSFSTSAVRQRLDLLNEDRNGKIGFEITEMIKHNMSRGTKVQLTIPLKE